MMLRFLRLSQNLLQAGVLVLHAHLLIELQGGIIAVPDMQCDVIETVRAGVLQCVLIELLSDMLSAGSLVHAQVIDIQLPPVDENVAAFIAEKHAEAVAEDLVVFIHADEDWPRVILKQNLQLQTHIRILQFSA